MFSFLKQKWLSKNPNYSVRNGGHTTVNPNLFHRPEQRTLGSLHFEKISDKDLSKKYFFALETFLMQRLRQLGSQQFVFEKGFSENKHHPYFYIQPFNQEGYLFRCEADGWNVYRAKKDKASDTFLAKTPAIEEVVIYQNRIHPEDIRVQTQLFELDRMGDVVYQFRMLDFFQRK